MKTTTITIAIMAIAMIAMTGTIIGLGVTLTDRKGSIPAASRPEQEPEQEQVPVTSCFDNKEFVSLSQTLRQTVVREKNYQFSQRPELYCKMKGTQSDFDEAQGVLRGFIDSISNLQEIDMILVDNYSCSINYREYYYSYMTYFRANMRISTFSKEDFENDIGKDLDCNTTML